MVEITGYKGRLTKSDFFIYNPNYRLGSDTSISRDRNDWNSWEPATVVPSSISDNKLETQVYLSEFQRNNNRPNTNMDIYIHLTDFAGNADDIEKISSGSQGAIKIKQTNIYQSHIIPLDEPVKAVEIELFANGNDVTLNNIDFTQKASVFLKEDKKSELEFPILIEEGSYTNLIVYTSTNVNAQPCDLYELELNAVDAGDVPVSISGIGYKGYVDSAPEGIVIDGLFEDWSNHEKTIDEDTNYIPNPNVDLDNYAFDTGSDTFGVSPISFYLQVKGSILAGTSIPTDNPEYVGGENEPKPDIAVGKDIDRPLSALPKRTGEDSIYIFMDTDKDKSTGYRPDLTFPVGADHVIEIIGQYGEIIRSKLMIFEGSDRTDFAFSDVENIDAACDDVQLEAQVDPGLLTGNKIPDVYFHIVDWEGIEDYSLDPPKIFNIQIFTTRAGDTVTTYIDPGFLTSSITFESGNYVYVLVSDGSSTGGVVSAQAQDTTYSDTINFDVRDDGNGYDDTSGDGNYKGAFIVVYDGGTSGSKTNDATDTLDLDYNDQAMIICDLDNLLDPGWTLITLVPEFPSLPLPILFIIIFVAFFEIRRYKSKGGDNE
jgi:hypothetical protein